MSSPMIRIVITAAAFEAIAAKDNGDGTMTGRSPAIVTDHLKGMNFPASKDDLLAKARDTGAGQDVLEVLESFPDEKFNSMADVIKAYRDSDQAPQTGIIGRKP
jgi:hypothetical protein